MVLHLPTFATYTRCNAPLPRYVDGGTPDGREPEIRRTIATVDEDGPGEPSVLSARKEPRVQLALDGYLACIRDTDVRSEPAREFTIAA
jgi:hypothetical protein